MKLFNITHRNKEVDLMSEIIFLHLKDLEDLNHRPSTIEARRKHLSRFCAWIHCNDIEHIDHDLIMRYLDRHKVSANYRASEINHLKKFFAWAYDEGHIKENPAARLKRPIRRRGLPRPIGTIDLKRALEASEGEMRAWLFLAAFAGLRACEIAQLSGEDIDRERKLLIIREQKGGSSGSVPMNQALEPILEAYPKTGWLFKKKCGNHIEAAYVSKRANLFLHDLDIDDTFHSLRHWFGTNCYRNSKDLRATQEAMRHTSPESTQIYTLIESETIRHTVEALPNIGDVA